MNEPFDKPIVIQKIDEVTEQWADCYGLHARINKSKTGNEYLNAGAVRGKRTLTFEVRYFADIENISFDTQGYRILYRGIPFNIEDYDDYKLQHKTVKLLGVSY